VCATIQEMSGFFRGCGANKKNNGIDGGCVHLRIMGLKSMPSGTRGGMNISLLARWYCGP
jgi:hypothetical protein